MSSFHEGLPPSSKIEVPLPSIEMPYYSNSTMRRNHQLIDSAIGHTREFLSTPQIATALGQQTGYLVGLMDRVIVPNVHHGKVEMPEMHQKMLFLSLS